jgi:hypothetical protein
MEEKNIDEKEKADGGSNDISESERDSDNAFQKTPLFLTKKAKQSLASIGLLILGVGIISQVVDRPPKIEETKIEVIKTIPWTKIEVVEEGEEKISRTTEGYYKISKINNGDCTWYKLASSDDIPKEQCFEKKEDIDVVIDKIPFQQKNIAREGILETCFTNTSP